MGLITKKQCLKNSDTQFVISGFTNGYGDALGYCLCPFGSNFDYDYTKSCVSSKETIITNQWPVPIANYSLETTCRTDYEEHIVDGLTTCLSTKCPSGEELIRVNSLPRCKDNDTSLSAHLRQDMTYGYLRTNPCKRISAPSEDYDANEIWMRKNDGYLTYFPDKCPLADQPGILPKSVDVYNVEPIKYETPSVDNSTVIDTKITVKDRDNDGPLTMNEKTLIVMVAVVFLILMWIFIIIKWLYQ